MRRTEIPQRMEIPQRIDIPRTMEIPRRMDPTEDGYHATMEDGYMPRGWRCLEDVDAQRTDMLGGWRCPEDGILARTSRRYVLSRNSQTMGASSLWTTGGYIGDHTGHCGKSWRESSSDPKVRG